MSKPLSGHFKNTTGYRLATIILERKDSPKNSIVKPEFKKQYDTREHPTKYKQLGSKKRKELRQKLKNRTITAEEYKRLKWQQRLDKRRKAGIDAFWEREVYLIRRGLKPTRNWSATQIADILNGKRPKYKGITLQSHHTYSVAKYPHLANVGELIYPATKQEHFNRWHNKNYKNSVPGKPANTKYKEEF